MVEELKVSEFLSTLSSKQPVPGGGGASALAGALGNGLGTDGGKPDHRQEALCRRGGGDQGIAGAHGASAARFCGPGGPGRGGVRPLAAAYGLPSGTEEEKANKAKVMEARLLDATYVPLEIMEKAVEMLGVLDVLAVKGSRMAISDVGVGVQFVRTALLGAVMNVYINTKSMKDREKAEELNREAEELVRTGTALADRIYGVVLDGLKN